MSDLPGFHSGFESPNQSRFRSECRLAQVVECRDAIEQALFIGEVTEELICRGDGRNGGISGGRMPPATGWGWNPQLLSAGSAYA